MEILALIITQLFSLRLTVQPSSTAAFLRQTHGRTPSIHTVESQQPFFPKLHFVPNSLPQTHIGKTVPQDNGSRC